jgi:outer membrane protein assembly factor BamB
MEGSEVCTSGTRSVLVWLLGLALAVTVLAPGPNAGASVNARTLWVARYNGPASRDDQASSIATSPDGSKVFVTGGSEASNSYDDYATFAYDAFTGAELWGKRYNGPANAGDDATSIAASRDGSKVFVTGPSFGGDTGGDYATVAYDAADGATMWVKRYNGPGNGNDYATSLAPSSDGSKVFVTGFSRGPSDDDYATVAYDAATGATLWTKRYNGPQKGFDVAYSIAASSNRREVFVTGSSQGKFEFGDYATVAYDSSTGATLWVARYNGPGNSADNPHWIATSPDGSEVFVTGDSDGGRRDDGYATVAYDASTGARLWVSRYFGANNTGDRSFSLVASTDGSKVFVTGWSSRHKRNFDFITVAYEAATGRTLWLERYDDPDNGDDYAISVGVSNDGSKVFVTGSSTGATQLPDYTTVAYQTSTGSVLWVKRYNDPENSSEGASSLAVSPDGSRVFVTGRRFGRGRYDYLTLAYAT